MPKKITTTVYTKEDFDELENMHVSRVIELLDRIQDGWLPQNCVYVPEEDEEYTEGQYRTTELHVAINKAIQILKKGETK